MVKEEKCQVFQYLDVANVYYVINPMLLIVFVFESIVIFQLSGVMYVETIPCRRMRTRNFR